MKKTLNLGLIICMLCLIITSCSSTKKVATETRDASSYKQAIIVKSIAEEYEYVNKVCSGCQFMEQALVFEKNKPYDVLTFKKSNGEEISYYFDISEFFGKGF